MTYEVVNASYTMRGDTASDPPAYEIGEQVSIIYNPSSPESSQINSWSERWLMPALLIPSMLLAAVGVNFFGLRAVWRG
ncbi:MAG: DUF3592 domain-containing protein [Anaerolineales bacterium]|nr:DUF3592 domain-containing protein [Anaerolineales bacterium]